VEYDRFARRDAAHAIRVHLAPPATDRGELRLAVDSRYLEGMKIRTIQPPPLGVEAAADHLVYRFDVAEPGRPFTVSFEVEPGDIGLRRAWFAVPDTPPTRFRQLVYP
jgi:hypothetical protein